MLPCIQSLSFHLIESIYINKSNESFTRITLSPHPSLPFIVFSSHFWYFIFFYTKNANYVNSSLFLECPLIAILKNRLLFP